METVDPIIATDVVLVTIILIYSIYAYKKNKNRATMYLAVTFVLLLIAFGLELFNFREVALYFIIVIRVIAYLSIAAAVHYLKEGSGVFSLFRRQQ